MKNFVLLLIILFSFVFSSCNFNANVTSDNREEDKIEAEYVTSLFYAYLKNKDYEKTHDFFSPLFFEVTSKDQLDEIFTSSDAKLGGVKDKELTSWETKVKTGTDSSSEYYLVYNVTREKINSTETIRLQKENNKIKILAYNVRLEEISK